MARTTFNVERGYAISAENGDTLVEILSGTGAPGGDTGPQDASPIGSLWLRTDGTGGQYKKTSNAGAAGDWEEVGNVALDELVWRSEKVQAATNDTLAVGSQNPTTWTDNESGTDATNWNVGDHILSDVDGTPALFEISVKTSPTDITLAAAATPIADNNTFVVQNYFPDTPAANELQAIVHFPLASGPGIKISDVNWQTATFIDISGGYTAGSGDPGSGDSVESAIEKVDGNNDAQDTLLGTSQGDTDLGTFPGDIISDSNSVKGALTELEAAIEAIETEASVNVPAATPTPVLPLLVDDFNYIEYEVWCFEQSDETAKEGFKFTVLHDGTSVADATDNGTDNSVSNKHNINKISGLTIDHVLTGTGAAQTIALEISATAAITVKARRTAVGN